MFQLHFFHGSAPGGAGVVDEYVDSSEFGYRGVDDRLNIPRIFYVASEGDRFRAELLQFGRGFFATFDFSGAKNQVRAHFREADGHLQAQAGGTAGDDGDTPAQIKKFLGVHSQIRRLPSRSRSAKFLKPSEKKPGREAFVNRARVWC